MEKLKLFLLMCYGASGRAQYRPFYIPEYILQQLRTSI